MSTPWERAHERLIATLPVRTHSQRDELLAAADDRRGRQPMPAAHKAGRPLLYRGRQYASIRAASKALNINPRRVYELLRTGSAAYVTDRSTTRRKAR